MKIKNKIAIGTGISVFLLSICGYGRQKILQKEKTIKNQEEMISKLIKKTNELSYHLGKSVASNKEH